MPNTPASAPNAVVIQVGLLRERVKFAAAASWHRGPGNTTWVCTLMPAVTEPAGLFSISVMLGLEATAPRESACAATSLKYQSCLYGINDLVVSPGISPIKVPIGVGQDGGGEGGGGEGAVAARMECKRPSA